MKGTSFNKTEFFALANFLKRNEQGMLYKLKIINFLILGIRVYIVTHGYFDHIVKRYHFFKNVIIPHATSCTGYTVFDPSVSQSVCQSVSQSCFSCQRKISETAKQNFVKRFSNEGHNV